MRSHHGRVVVLALVVALAGCSSAPGQSETSPPVGSTVAPPSSTTSTISAAPFPVATFAAISEDPVIDGLAAKFQVALDDLVGSDGFGEAGGMTATVMTAEGTWSGARRKRPEEDSLRKDPCEKTRREGR